MEIKNIITGRRMNELNEKKMDKETIKTLEIEHLSKETVESHIESCEGVHIQQVIYSTYHRALTQICYGCKKVRTSLEAKVLNKQEE